MASNELHIVAVVSPKPGKTDEIIKIFEEAAEQVRAKEPGTLTYFAFKPKKGDELIIVEKYKDAQAVNFHGNTDHFKAWSKKVAPLVTGPTQVKIGRAVAGFQEKSSSKL